MFWLQYRGLQVYCDSNAEHLVFPFFRYDVRITYFNSTTNKNNGDTQYDPEPGS